MYTKVIQEEAAIHQQQVVGESREVLFLSL